MFPVHFANTLWREENTAHLIVQTELRFYVEVLTNLWMNTRIILF